MKHIKTKIGIVAIVFTVGIAAVAFSHGWNGSGYGGYMMGPGNGGHMMGYGPYGYGNLSPQDAAKLEQSQQKFLNDSIEDARYGVAIDHTELHITGMAFVQHSFML